MKRKPAVAILCALLIVCIGAIGFQAHNAKKEKPTETNSITQQAETASSAAETTQAGESTTAQQPTSQKGESTSAAKGAASGNSTTKPQTTKPKAAGQTTSAKQTTAKQTTAKPTTTTTTTKPTAEAQKEIKISLSITCKNAVKYGNTSVPQSGYILGSKSYTAKEGATVFDALKALCSQNGISLKYNKPYYIQGIGGLNEKDCGSSSGWMYRVNGTAPMTACNKYTLKNGDTVEWYYVTNSTDN